MAQLGNDGVENGVVTAVALAVGPADHDAVALKLRAAEAADDDLVIMLLLFDHGLRGEVALRLFIERLAHAAALCGICRQREHVGRERGDILWLEQQAVFAVVDEVGHAANVRGDGRAVHARALRQGIGEGLGQRREHIDIQCLIEAVDVLEPAGEEYRALRTQLLGQRADLFGLLAVARNDKADVRRLLHGRGKGAHERRHILDGGDAGGNAEHDGFVRRRQADAAQPLIPRDGLERRGEVDAVIQRENALRVEPARNKELAHAVRNADPRVKAAQRDLVDVAVGQRGQRAAEIVEPVVAVDGGDDGDARLPLHERTDHVRAGAVAVQQLAVVVPDDGKDALAHRHGVAAFNDGRRDAETAGLLGERSLHKADQVDILRAVQALQQGKNVRFRAADVAAGDQMDEFHTVIPQNGQISLSKKVSAGFFAKLLSELQNKFLCFYFAILPLRRVI